jgi:hypothetical protein
MTTLTTAPHPPAHPHVHTDTNRREGRNHSLGNHGIEIYLHGVRDEENRAGSSVAMGTEI